MGHRALKRHGGAVAASIAICVLFVLAAPAARAGTIWVTDGSQIGCNAFGVYGDFAAFTAPSRCPMSIQAIAAIPLGQNAYWMTTAPAGITINSAWTADGDVTAGGLPGGMAVGDFWMDKTTGAWGGSTLGANQHWFNTGLEGSPNINSQIYGIQLTCTQNNWSFGGCGFATPPWFTVSGIELAGTESSAPYVTGQGSLWGAGSPVWNPPNDPWTVTLYASDVSGICSSEATVANSVRNGPSEPRDNTVWQQCPNPVSWSFPVDTRSSVPTDGSLTIDLTATNAAGIEYTIPDTVPVDNEPVGVSFRSSNDPNPSVWVNHGVAITAAATAGPSGVGGMNCSVDRGSAKAYPAAGLAVDGDGIHTVTCTAWNNAVGPQGQHNTGSSSMSVHIDEAPPTLSFEPQNPRDPTGLVVNTSDSESGVASGSLQIAPAGGGAWSTLPTSFDGTQLLGHFDDAELRGSYDFRATSCDNVGNCASTTERMTLPLRIASDQQVSLTKIVNPVRRRVVVKRVRVGWHWATIRRGNHIVRVKRGGHLKTVKITEYVRTCTTKRIRTGPHTWKLKRTCAPPHVRLTSTLRVPYGHSVTIHGLYTTGEGVPLSGQAVDILTAPDNGFNAFTPIATATTAGDGSWSATLPPGPSRIIRAVTAGTATILPSSGQATVIVPARIRLIRVWPKHVAWGGTVHLVGQLFGGYLPPGGALVRLRIGYKSTYNTYGVEEHVTGDGRFSTVATFGPGDPSVSRTYWFQIASLPMGNYPFAPAASQRVPVVVGGHAG
jgi:hypothetical protein